MMDIWVASVSSSSVNLGVPISLQDPAFNSFGYISRNRMAGLRGNSVFLFFEEIY